ncbi:unnamed protein product [Symbiodinium natans]|uniref:Uncharacterized protein n=1 Tax=Symbiodinium natans TaxID=878477 RepID=A0A812R641_9DINO|nr:unnamed protein product [Symbiodinium natans]
MACATALILNASQPLPPYPLKHECFECQVFHDRLVLPARHPSVRCLLKAQHQPIEAVDAEGAMASLHNGHVRKELVQHMLRCRQKSGRLFWSLKLRGLVSSLRPEHIIEAFLLCAPAPCSSSDASAWLASTYLEGNRRAGVFRPAAPQATCAGRGFRELPPRLAFPAESQEAIAELLHQMAPPPGMGPSILSHGPGHPLAGQISFFVTPGFSVAGREVLETQGGCRRGVAALFAGAWRFSERTASGIHRHLLRPLRATAFAVASGAHRRDEHRLRRLWPTLARIKRVQDLSYEELRASIKPTALALYEALGSGALSPLRGNPAGANLQSLRKLMMVLELARDFENQRGCRFDWLVHSRLDMIWVADHPPLAFFDKTRIWTAPLLGARGWQHQNRFIINDWHAVVPRHLANAYWGRWGFIQKGWAPWTPVSEPGELLAGVLEVLQVQTGQFDAVFCLEHCHAWACQFKSWLSDEMRASRWRWPDSRLVLITVRKRS